ncbi:MAG: helix-turn-helix domain-containing protein [Ruminiclostridium sp.]|nr:helix-turn-helix domain-containing protein [Ruminiclostridium sp.]
MKNNKISLCEKYLLTVKEAGQYFGIGENKMYRLAAEHLNSEYNFVIKNGSRTMINRKKLEDFLNASTAI